MWLGNRYRDYGPRFSAELRDVYEQANPSHPTRDDDMANLSDAQRHDLDETRRLLYMALVVRRTKKYNLAGTIVNAIKHHQQVDIDTDELIDRVVEYLEGEAEDDGWVRGQIRRIVDALGD